jgi:hypothetical protein
MVQIPLDDVVPIVFALPASQIETNFSQMAMMRFSNRSSKRQRRPHLGRFSENAKGLAMRRESHVSGFITGSDIYRLITSYFHLLLIILRSSLFPIGGGGGWFTNSQKISDKGGLYSCEISITRIILLGEGKEYENHHKCRHC